ncbi:MAG: GAF domain-containing protein [Flavihumibacter sp.]
MMQDQFFTRSKLSFAPLLAASEKRAGEGRPGAHHLYRALLDKIAVYPELMQPIENKEILAEHRDWVDLLMTTLFPITASDDKDLFAVSVPFGFDFIYTSNRFRNQFLDEQGNLRHLEYLTANKSMAEEKCATAYKLILDKAYGRNIAGNINTVMHYKNPLTGLTQHFEMEVDTSFMEVKVRGPLPGWRSDFQPCNLKDLSKTQELQEWLPLDLFTFEGITIIRIKEVTPREVISNIKNILLERRLLEDVHIYKELENEMRSLFGIPQLKLHITPLMNVTGQLTATDESGYKNTLLKSIYDRKISKELFDNFCQVFNELEEPLLLPVIDDLTIKKYPFLQALADHGLYSASFFPLRSNGKLMGIMAAAHPTPGIISSHHIELAMLSLPLFSLALEKAAEALDVEVDKVIKRHFTAVQSSVEWKFTDAALQYVLQKRQGIKAKMAPITFDHVFPLYGAIDVRNSSVVRNNAIQLDLLEQLKAASLIVEKAQAATNTPLLKEIAYRIEKFRYNVSNILFSGDEILIDQFLKEELVELFEHLRIIVPSLGADIDTYFSGIDPRAKLQVTHRHEFEESITLINQELARFIDQEQEQAQKIFPHYFERFVTDGIDFNMYIGQSITPDKPFDTFYLKNLKMWQLSTLAGGAVMVSRLQSKLSLPLQTTQLILAHSLPISISFRSAERKFDVEGAYNIRYEIIKKRIDKVHLKDSTERLTQPGKLAIVFSQSKEAAEYMGYIEYLQNLQILTSEVEQLDLEELQGVTGLRALRVGINMDQPLSLSELEAERHARQSSVI